MRLRNKVAIVTGGAHGMGEAEARLFAREGAKVVVADILADMGETVADDIRREGGEARFERLDVTSDADWERVIAATLGVYGKLDILVNNAGIGSSTFNDIDGTDGWDRIIAVNQTSVFLGTRRAAAEMTKSVGSDTGHPAYGASKGAVRLYTKQAAVRYGPRGVRVNSVHPGYMPPMLNSTNAGERADKIERTPLRRLGEVIEVANGVLFLASDEASFITGTELVIDGGWVAQ